MARGCDIQSAPGTQHPTPLVCTSVVNGADPAELHEAARRGDCGRVRRLIDAGTPADNTLDDEGWTALMWAAPFPEVLEVLLGASAETNYATPGGESVLMVFARRGTPETVRMLLAAGAALHYSDDTGNNALTEAAAVGNIATIPVLVTAGLGVDARTRSGETALFGAAREGEWEAVKLLLELGADPLAQITSGPRAGQTALDVAKEGGHDLTASILEAAQEPGLRAALGRVWRFDFYEIVTVLRNEGTLQAGIAGQAGVVLGRAWSETTPDAYGVWINGPDVVFYLHEDDLAATRRFAPRSDFPSAGRLRVSIEGDPLGPIEPGRPPVA